MNFPAWWNMFISGESLESKLMALKTSKLVSLGSGSSRIAYLLPNGNVLKVAMNDKGFAQNEQEMNVVTDPSVKNIVAKIYQFDTNYQWLISEYVEQFKNEHEFEDHVGFPIYYVKECSSLGYEFFQCFSNEMEEIAKDIELSQERLDNPNTSEMSKNRLVRDLANYKKDLEERKKFTESSFYKSLEQLVSSGAMTVDVGNFRHWGLTNEGRVVLLDYGLNDHIYDTMYSESL